MYPFSRSVRAPAACAFCIASCPAFSAAALGPFGSHIWCQPDIPTPHHAIPHDGSSFATSRNCLSASSYQNECSSATPRVNDFCTSGLQLFSKCTAPSSAGAVPSLWCSCCATAATQNANERTAVPTSRNVFICNPHTSRAELYCDLGNHGCRRRFGELAGI